MRQSQYFVRFNWLYNDIIEAGEPSPIHGFVSAQTRDREKHDIFPAGLLPNAPTSLIAIHTRHTQIQHNYFRSEARCEFDRLNAVVGRSNFTTEIFEQLGEYGRGRLIVIDQ